MTDLCHFEDNKWVSFVSTICVITRKYPACFGFLYIRINKGMCSLCQYADPVALTRPCATRNRGLSGINLKEKGINQITGSFPFTRDFSPDQTDLHHWCERLEKGWYPPRPRRTTCLVKCSEADPGSCEAQLEFQCRYT